LKSINGGTSFTSFSAGLPNIGKNVIVHQGRNDDNPLYIGTSLGVYYKDDTMSQWEPFDINLPNVSVTDLEINLEDEKVIAATYGRGIWQSSIPVLAPSDDIKFTEILNPTAVAINCYDTVIPQVAVKNNGINVINTVSFNYSIDATPYTYEWTGVINPSQTISIDLPQVALAKGAYTLLVNATISNDAFSDNNTGSKTFYLNDSGTVNVTNTFENQTDNLLEYNEGSSTGLWTRGIRVGGAMATGTNNVYATSLSGNHPDVTKAFLTSQCYDLSQVVNPEISFKMAFDLEVNWDIIYVQYSTNSGENWQVLGEQGANPEISFKMAFDLEVNWDIIYVQYSTNSGENWQVLGEQGANWYNSNRTPQTTGNDCYNCVGAQWTGTNTTLQTYNYSLASLSSESNVIFRIVFQSDDEVNQEGAVVDDFLIAGTLANQTFELNKIVIYPNPSNGIFTILSSDVALDEVEVFDVTGKTIYKNKNLQTNNTGATLNLSHVSSGIYFVRITSENQSTVKRIIKN